MMMICHFVFVLHYAVLGYPWIDPTDFKQFVAGALAYFISDGC